MKVTPNTLLCVILLAAVIGCAGQPTSQPPEVTAEAVSPLNAPPAVAPTTPDDAAPPAEPEPLTVVSQTAAEGGVTVATLSNGMTVIVKATRQVPVVCVRAYVRAGGLYEGKWLGCGISHLTEHLVAKGAEHDMGNMGKTTAAEAKQASGRVEEIGGQSNAYTSLTHTGYYIAAASGKTLDCIDLVADWLARPTITPEDFRREHGVVQRELEMGADNPGRQMWYAHSANFFRGHPAAVPVIGFAKPLAGLKYEDVLAYYDRMYVPQNMVFCIVGDVDVDAVVRRTLKAFAGFAPGRTPDLSLPPVPPVTGVRRVTRPQKGLNEATQQISFRTIPLVHEDLYALDVLSYVLTQGRSSRLERTIRREKKLVTSISSSSWTPEWGAGMFTVAFRSQVDKADAAEAAIIDQLRAIASDGVDANELERAKRQKVADFVYSQQSVESIGATLARDYLSTGDVNFSRHYTDRIQAVTAERVRQMARKYFDFDAMVITRLVPAEAKDAAEAPAPTTQPADETAAETMFRLPNGLRVVLRATDTVELVSMTFATTGGLLLEDEKSNGMGTLMAALSTHGAGDRTAEQIAEFFDHAGGGVSGNCGNNTFYWQTTILDDSFEEALDVIADIIIRPTYSAKELDILRPSLEAAIKKQDEDWFGELRKFFRRKFFTGSPYRMLPAGSLEVLSSATPERIAEYHRRHVKAGASVLAICGNFDATATAERIRKLFADLPAGETTLDVGRARKLAPGGEQHVLDTQKQVAGIMVAAPGMKATNLEDRFAIDVMDTIISGWRLPSGWLHNELRGKRLVYVVHAYNWSGLAPGAFMVYAACEPEKAPQVIGIIRRNLARAAEYEPTQKEVDLAVNSILTAELLGKQSMASLSMSAALDELYGFGYDFRNTLERHYRRVTPQDVQRVARKYLGGDLAVTVTTPQGELLRQTGTKP